MVVLRRRLKAARFVRPDLVVFGAKGAQRPGKRTESRRDPPLTESRAEGAVKPFDFALGLGVADAAIAQVDALLQDKHGQPREPMPMPTLPRDAMIDRSASGSPYVWKQCVKTHWTALPPVPVSAAKPTA